MIARLCINRELALAGERAYALVYSSRLSAVDFLISAVIFCPGTDRQPNFCLFCPQTRKLNPCWSNVTPALGQKTISHLRADRTRSCLASSKSDYVTPVLSNSHFYRSGYTSGLWGLVERGVSSCEHSGCSRKPYHQRRRYRSLLFWPCSSALPLPFESVHTHTQKKQSFGNVLQKLHKLNSVCADFGGPCAKKKKAVWTSWSGYQVHWDNVPSVLVPQQELLRFHLILRIIQPRWRGRAEKLRQGASFFPQTVRLFLCTPLYSRGLELTILVQPCSIMTIKWTLKLLWFQIIKPYAP